MMILLKLKEKKLEYKTDKTNTIEWMEAVMMVKDNRKKQELTKKENVEELKYNIINKYWNIIL